MEFRLNKCAKIVALAVPVLGYNFGIIKWRSGEIKKIGRRIRKILTVCKMRHPIAGIHWRYVKWKEGRRGLLQIEETCKAEIINNAECLNTKHKEDQFVNFIKSNESKEPKMNSAVKTEVKVVEELKKSNENSDKKGRTRTHKGKIRRVLKRKNGKAK
jgi:hypothetical protein